MCVERIKGLSVYSGLMSDPDIDALNQKISNVLGFFPSGLRYEYIGEGRGRIYFKKNGEERLVLSLSFTYDGDELYPSLRSENGYENASLQRALMSISVEDRNPFSD